MQLPIKVLRLQEQDRVIRSQRGPEQTVGVQRRRRHHDTKAGDMGERDLAGLAVVGASTGKVAADGRSQDQRTRELPFGPPAQRRHLVADLHHGGPDVVEELDFRHGLQAP